MFIVYCILMLYIFVLTFYIKLKIAISAYHCALSYMVITIGMVMRYLSLHCDEY